MSEVHRASRLTLSPTAEADYTSWLADLKQRICKAQQRAVLSANRELVLLYWHIGRDILERQQALKDSYTFDFMAMTEPYSKWNLRNSLLHKSPHRNCACTACTIPTTLISEPS